MTNQELADASKSEDCQRIINRCSNKKHWGTELEQSGIYMDISSGKLLEFANWNITRFKNGKSTK